jgi:hypothetical protein
MNKYLEKALSWGRTHGKKPKEEPPAREEPKAYMLIKAADHKLHWLPVRGGKA